MKNKKKKIAIVSVILAVALAVTCVGIYAFTKNSAKNDTKEDTIAYENKEDSSSVSSEKDSKDSSSEKEKDSSSNTTTESKSGTSTSTNSDSSTSNSSNSSSSSNKSSSSSSNSSSSSSSNKGSSSSSSSKTCNHNWVANTVHHDAVYKTVHHDAVYEYGSHYKFVFDKDSNGYEHVIEGDAYTDGEENALYARAEEYKNSHFITNPLTGESTRLYYNTVSWDVERLISDEYDEQVLVTAAYDEVTGYTCSKCGATKSA